MSSRHPSRVLVIDDEPELRELLADALRDPDLLIDLAGSGQEALRHAMMQKPDLVVTDICLGDDNGLEVIDRLRKTLGDVPAVVITGFGDARSLTEASRRRPVELMTKPLDLARLRQTVRQELARQVRGRRAERRTRTLRRLARVSNQQRRQAQQRLDNTCTDLAQAYGRVNQQLAVQQAAMIYQKDLIAAANDDDVFRSLFRTFVRRTGPVFGVSLVCDAEAQLQIVGRFGTPAPDSLPFCQALARPLVESVLENPRITVLDAGDNANRFDTSIRKYLCGVTAMAVPLLPAEGEMIGVVILYRKGEQPITDEDAALAELVGPPTALAVRRND